MSVSHLLQQMAGKRFSTRIQPGFVTAMRGVPDHIPKTDYYSCGTPKTAADRIHLFQDEEEVLKIRNSAKLARKVLNFASRTAVPGMSTEELDILCHNEIVKHNACPSPINYHGFPKAICTSVNDVICHGIPDSRMLKDGDVLSIDVSVFLNGYHGDNCTTVIVGTSTDDNANKLVATTKESLEAGIAACKPGGCLSSIGAAIEDVANSNGFAVVREFLGHGTGPILHMKPLVHHYRNRHTLELRPGMVFTIEPILVEGGRRIKVWEDGWTACTFDGGRGAQFEHQVLITDEGVEVLTVSSD